MKKNSLSSKLLWLTIGFVMLAEVLIFLPSIANYRKGWLEARLENAELAAKAIDIAGNDMLSDEAKGQLLQTAMVDEVAIFDEKKRIFFIQSEKAPKIVELVNLSASGHLDLMGGALSCLLFPANHYMRVQGPRKLGGKGDIAIVLPRGELRQALFGFGLNVLGLSIIISLITAALVYWALRRLFVAPMELITDNIIAFSADPENKAHMIVPTERDDEIGIAERKLRHMQTDIQTALLQKKNLAELGLGVSKINHDLRNLLSTAQMVSDHLSRSEDPAVKRVAPRLVRSINQAIELCGQTLDYSKMSQLNLTKADIELTKLIEEAELMTNPGKRALKIELQFNKSQRIFGDFDQLTRVFANLFRNSLEHFKGDGSCQITVDLENKDGAAEIFIGDNGPGLSQEAEENIFTPFSSKGKQKGTGLGLVIAKEIIEAHDGTLVYIGKGHVGKGRAGQTGATFKINLPQ